MVSTNGTQVTGRIEKDGDADYWEFNATDNTTYRIKIDAGENIKTNNGVSWALNVALFGLYYDHPDYDPQSITNTHGSATK